jgi:3-hydroxyisobutyrate dehydrogenase-like beta-hydroxyacid dehydrogenase
MTNVAIVAPGNMGSAVGAGLVARGARVLTSLDGRGPGSLTRAAAAGMQSASDKEIAAADVILSIVPPGIAFSTAERFAKSIAAAEGRPLYVDCNAISPATVQNIAALFEDIGCPFVDASIIGHPPRDGGPDPRFYVCGPHADRMEELRPYGLDVRTLEAPIGAASILKMCYGGINKGIIAIGSAMILAAIRSGAATALRDEMAQSHAPLLASYSRSIPDMIPKAGRWVFEMQEISGFVGEGADSEIYEAIAAFYAALADQGQESDEVKQLRAFFTSPP